MIYATGIGGGAAADGLVARLVATGLARTDPHGIRLDVTPSLRIMWQDGGAAAGLWTPGPIVRSVFWECTAVPDVRVQAQAVAAAAAQHRAASQCTGGSNELPG